jgi:hypothetical protein
MDALELLVVLKGKTCFFRDSGVFGEEIEGFFINDDVVWFECIAVCSL